MKCKVNEMDFHDEIEKLSAKVSNQVEHIKTEEATKNAFVMPFIQVLGYNVFDPTEVIPEFIADIGEKKGEKVDYAIMENGKPIILIECKSARTNLEKEHASQLRRYFQEVDSRVGILTDGIIYKFFSDLDKPNKMDKKPFLEFNIMELKDLNNQELQQKVKELERFRKDIFNVEKVIIDASELKYTKEIKKILQEQLQSPSEDFVRFITNHIYTGVKTKSVINKFTSIVERAYNQFFTEEVYNRLHEALKKSVSDTEKSNEIEDSKEKSADKILVDGIETTEEEIQGLLIVRAILCEIVEPQRVFLRDFQSFCNILLDDTLRRPICRFHFDRKQKYIGFFDENKKEEKIPINNLNEMYLHANKIKATVGYYDKSISFDASS